VRLVCLHGICFDSAQHWCNIVADGLVTDDVQVTKMCEIIITLLKIV